MMAAMAAGFADHRRSRRADPDRIGLLDWRAIQMFALIVAVAMAIVALHD